MVEVKHIKNEKGKDEFITAERYSERIGNGEKLEVVDRLDL